MSTATGAEAQGTAGDGAGRAGAAPEGRPSLPGLVVARTGIELKQFFRQRDSVVFTFAFPVILLFIFGSVFSDDIAPGVSFTQYFTAGMVASGIVLSSFQSLAIGIAVERDEGSLKRLRGTPMPPAATRRTRRARHGWSGSSPSGTAARCRACRCGARAWRTSTCR